jgi:hypothetical protein
MTADVMPFGEARVARAMLARVFGTLPEGYHIVLFRLNPARSVSFTTIDTAAGDAAGQADVYVHVGLTRQPFKGGDRPEATEIDGLSGLWADIDIADPVHKKPGLPPDQMAALKIVDAMGLEPGLVIHSGHGLQCWWPMAEVWTFDDDAERRRARVLARAWALTLKERARALGFTVDMVSDISRVLRVAGTVNAKDPQSIVPVRILKQSSATIGEDDVLGILLDGSWDQAEREIDGRRTTGDQVVYGDLTLDPQAEPPWAKLDALRTAEQRADVAWKRTRTRRTETWSVSEWDQSLATYAAQAGWSRQEIANLLIYSRSKNGDDLKLRQDYYAATINKAMAGHEEEEAVREAVATAAELSSAPPDGRSDTERSDVLARLSKAIGIEITRVTRSRSEPPVFGIETPRGGGSLGSISAVISNRKFREKVAELTNVIPRSFKSEQWDTIAQGLLELAELEELGVETTLVGQAETLVSVYLGNHALPVFADMQEKTREVMAIRMEPFMGDDGATRIFASGLRVWLSEHQHEPMTRTEIGTMLRAWGATSETMHFRINGQRTSRSLWRLPNRHGDGGG